MAYSFAMMSTDYAGLAWSFHVSPDSCNSPAYYEEYIRLCAISDQDGGMSVTHLVLDTDKNGEAIAIAGYVALRATSLVSTDENGVKIVNPSLEIAELAVDKDYERKGVGTMLVNLAIGVAAELSKRYLGIKYVILCADPKAVGFYTKNDFGKIGDLYETLRDGWNNNCEPMYISMQNLDKVKWNL